jgi:hypothetical protein
MLQLTTKTCTKCATDKPIAEFVKRQKSKDGRGYWCKACLREHNRVYYQISPNRRIANAKAKVGIIEASRLHVLAFLRDHPCVDCGERDPVVLQFDHRDRAEKVMEVSQAISQLWTLPRLICEIEKCDVRCANCHRRKTARENDEWRYRMCSSAP